MSQKMLQEFDRRWFLRQASLLIASFDLPGWAKPVRLAGTLSSSGRSPVEFLYLQMQARHPAELRDFYEKRLGLRILSESRSSLTVAAGSTELRFIQGDEDNKPFYHFAFNIPENKLEKAMQWMKGRAPLIPQPSTGSYVFNYPNWNANSIYFFDPAGNILEFIARHNLPNSAPGGFDPSDILYASEIGVVVPNVPSALSSLKGELGVKDYMGGSDSFAPIGDEHALFIVVRTDRKWFGTLMPGIFPAKVGLRGPTTSQHRFPSGALDVEVIRV